MYLAQIISDPLTKMLVAKFGNLQSVAFYEMGVKIIGVFRNVLVSANQAIVPTVASKNGYPNSHLLSLYFQNLALIRTLSFLIYPAFIGFGWFISMAWLGHIESEFINYLYLIALGFCFNTLSLPCHFINLGTGHLQSNVIATLTSAVIMFVLGLGLGALYGALGVVIAWAVSAIAGTWSLIYFFRKKYPHPYSAYRLNNNDLFILFSSLAPLLFYWCCDTFLSAWLFWQKGLLCFVAYGVFLFFAIQKSIIWEYAKPWLLSFFEKFRLLR